VSTAVYMIPNFIGEFDKEYLPKRTLEETYKITHFIVEKEKTARAFLKAIEHPTHQNDFVFVELDKHNNYVGFKMFFHEHIEKCSIGVLSEAGLPAIADPGSEVARYAHTKGVPVVPLAGSSSLFLALMASGFNGQNFKFNGYLPIDSKDKLCVAVDIEKEGKETIISKPIAQWKPREIELHKKPTIFIIEG